MPFRRSGLRLLMAARMPMLNPFRTPKGFLKWKLISQAQVNRSGKREKNGPPKLSLKTIHK